MKPSEYYSSINHRMLGELLNMPSLVRMVEVGCGCGALGAAVRARLPYAEVFGLEINPQAAAEARKVLSDVWEADAQTFRLPLDLGSVDAITYGDVLEHVVDPRAVLSLHKPYLYETGLVFCSIPNVAHYSVLEMLLKGSWQYEPMGILDSTHLRFFTFADVVKMLLDVGYNIDRVESMQAPDDKAERMIDRLLPVLESFGRNPAQARKELATVQWLVQASPQFRRGNVPSAVEPITFVVLVSDERVLRDNLLASPCLQPGSPHEVLQYRGKANAADGLNAGLAEARHQTVVFVHQDVYLPAGWDARLASELALAGDFAVAGCFGSLLECSAGVNCRGYIFDRDAPLCATTSCVPEDVQTLDEVLLVVCKPTSLRFDPALGFHLYGSDISMQAHEQGGRVVAIHNCCFHNSQTAFDRLPAAFEDSAREFKRKWAHRMPVATSCALFAKEGV